MTGDICGASTLKNLIMVWMGTAAPGAAPAPPHPLCPRKTSILQQPLSAPPLLSAEAPLVPLLPQSVLSSALPTVRTIPPHPSATAAPGGVSISPDFMGLNVFSTSALRPAVASMESAARYLGGTRSSLVVLPVTSYKHTCIYNGGWYGTPFDIPDPFVTSDLICGGNVRCASDNGGVPYCECYDGYFGENCEQSCDGLCQGVWPRK